MICLSIALGIAIGAAISTYFALTSLAELPDGPAGLIAGMIGNLFPNIHHYVTQLYDKYFRKVPIYRSVLQDYFVDWRVATVTSLCVAFGIYCVTSVITMVLCFGELTSEVPQIPQSYIEFIVLVGYFIRFAIQHAPADAPYHSSIEKCSDGGFG